MMLGIANKGIFVDIKSKQKLWTRDFILLAFGVLFIAFANYFFAASIAIYTETITNSAAYAGVVSGVFYIVSVGLRPVNGILVDKYGCRKMLIASTLLCTAACFCQNFATTLAVLLICRVLHGAGFSAYTTAGGTAAANTVPQERLSEGMGYYTLGVVLATALGPSIALSIIPNNTTPEFHILFDVAAAVCAISLLLTLCLSYGTSTPTATAHAAAKSKEEQRSASALPRTFLGFEAGVIWPAVIGCLTLFAYSSVMMFLALYGETKGWSNVGGFFTVYAVTMMLSRLFAGRISDKHGPDIVMLPAFVGGAACYAAIPFCQTLWQLCLTALPLGLAQGITNPQINVFCVSRCTRERRGTATAAYYGSLDLGVALGSIGVGLLIDAAGYRVTYLTAAGVSILALVIYLFTLSRWVGKTN